jgi:hypothetical protein
MLLQSAKSPLFRERAMIRSSRIGPLVAAAAIFAASGASAVSWGTSKLQWQYYAYGGAIDGGGSPHTCAVRRATCGRFYHYFQIATDPSSITFDYSLTRKPTAWSSSSVSLPPTVYNGLAVNLLSRGTITSVSIDPATNMVGFDSTHLSFTAKQIQVDWVNLSFSSSTVVKLDVTVAKTPDAMDRSVVDNPPRMPASEE